MSKTQEPGEARIAVGDWRRALVRRRIVELAEAGGVQAAATELGVGGR